MERENLTFKIHTASKDETKKVFYRYLIKGAVTKYKDTGQFYWRFFDEMNESRTIQADHQEADRVEDQAVEAALVRFRHDKADL